MQQHPVVMAVGEAITNTAAAPIASIENIKLSANWMAKHVVNQAKMQRCFDTVKAVGSGNCAQHWAIVSQSVRILCRCAPHGKMMVLTNP